MQRVGTGQAPRVRFEMVACLHFEPRLDERSCAQCGACCHRAFHFVPVGPDEPIVALRPDLISRAGLFGRREASLTIDRPDGFCRALEHKEPPYRCGIYSDRPQSCRDFALGGQACLEARRRIGLSPRP
jgi:Fe-S-cluster containining protein